MSEHVQRWRVGLLAVIVPSAMGLFFLLLAVRFQYPDVLDLPADQVLRRLGHASFEITAYWLGVTWSAVLLVALVVGLHRVVCQQALDNDHLAGRLPYLKAVTITGILAAVCMVLDLNLWVWLYPDLGRRYVEPTTAVAMRGDLQATWGTYHRYVGEMIGLYAATLFSGLWAVGAGWILLPARRLGRIAWLGIGAGLLFLLSVVPGVGFKAWAALNSAGFVLWFLWLAAIGWVLLREGRRTPIPRSQRSGET